MFVVRRTTLVLSTSLIFAAAFAGSNSVAEAVSNCQVLTELGGPEYTLDSSTKLSVKGFHTSIKYLTVKGGKFILVNRTDFDHPDKLNSCAASHTIRNSRQNNTPTVRSRSLKITAASEEPSVVIKDGELTIERATCAGVVPTQAPTPDPTSAAGPSHTLSNMVVVPGMLSLILGPLSATTMLLAYVLSQMTGATAQTMMEETCLPTVELQISVPFSCPYNNWVEGQCMTPTMIADQIVQALFVDFDTEVATKLLAEDYIQHNPTVPTGAAPVVAFIPALEESGLAIEVHRTLAEGNLVAYHSTYTNAQLFGGDTLVGFDVFRIEDGKVQEHWDNLQELAGPNPNGNTMVDGPTMVKYLQETETNKALAVELVETVLVGGNASAAPLFISTESYTQHNPQIADGLEGIGQAFETLAAAGTPIVYDSIELIVAEGNFVLLGSTGTFGEGNLTAYYDLFRVKDGLMVEHWDVIQSIPNEADFAHSNGKF